MKYIIYVRIIIVYNKDVLYIPMFINFSVIIVEMYMRNK